MPCYLQVRNQASLGNRNAIAESKFQKSESQIATASDNCLEMPSCHKFSQAIIADLAPASEPDFEPRAPRDADLQEQDIQQAPHDHNPIADAVPVKMLDRNAEQKQMLLELFDMVLANEVVRERDVALDRVQQLEQELQTLKAAAEAQHQVDKAHKPSTLDLQQLAVQVKQLQIDAQQLGEELQSQVAFQTSKGAPALDQSRPSSQSTDVKKVSGYVCNDSKTGNDRPLQQCWQNRQQRYIACDVSNLDWPARCSMVHDY